MNIKEIYERQEDGSVIFVGTKEVEAPVKEDLIKEKEELLLEIYEEIKRLKGE